MVENTSLSENILLQLHLAHARSLRSALSACQAQAHKHYAEDELESVVSAYLEVVPGLERLYATEYERAVKNGARTSTDLRRTREVLEDLLSACAEALRLAAELSAWVVRETGRSTEGSARLTEAAATLARLRSRLADEWPVYSVEECKAIRERIEQGDSLSLEDAFAQIAGLDRTAWRERAAAHAPQPREDKQA